MNYHRYIDLDVSNGPGNRCTLFLSGCEHRCPGCYNASTWSPQSGHPFTEALSERIIDDLSDTRIQRHGISLTGGDPLFPENNAEVLRLVRRIKEQCPTKTIWMWTGYLFEDLTAAQRAIIDYVDVLIDGPFVRALADPALRFRGSSNQRILELEPVH
jgi:anaerobic ribonucleoside-triphosphate reductase activating protein